MSKQIFRKSLQKFDKEKLRSSSRDAIKCYLCGLPLVGESFGEHAKICVRGLKRVELPKPDVNKDQFRIKKKAPLNLGATQPIGSTRVKLIEQNSCNEELQIVQRWIESDEKDEKSVQKPKEQPSACKEPELSQQDEPQIKQEEVNEALRSSTVLLEKIKLLTTSAAEPTAKVVQRVILEASQKTKPSEDVLTVGEFWEMVEGTPVNNDNREKLMRYALMTDFANNPQYKHLECYKEQLEEVEEIIEALGADSPASSRYTSLQLDILKSILQERKEDVKRPMTSSRPQTARLNKEQVDSAYPLQENFRYGVCGLCSAQLDFGEQCRRLPCGHRYHPQCIDGMLPQCPTCQ